MAPSAAKHIGLAVPGVRENTAWRLAWFAIARFPGAVDRQGRSWEAGSDILPR